MREINLRKKKEKIRKEQVKVLHTFMYGTKSICVYEEKSNLLIAFGRMCVLLPNDNNSVLCSKSLKFRARTSMRREMCVANKRK